MLQSDPSSDQDSDQETNRKTGIAYAAGFTLFASVAGFTGLGWLLDKWFQTTPWFLVLCLVLGSVAGLYQFIRMSSKTL